MHAGEREKREAIDAGCQFSNGWKGEVINHGSLPVGREGVPRFRNYFCPILFNLSQFIVLFDEFGILG